MILSKLYKILTVGMVVGLAATGSFSLAWQEGPRGETGGGGVAVPAADNAQASPPSEAEQIAGRILKAGSDLFDAKNASALAATYIDDGQVHIFSKPEGEPYKEDVKRGRADIEQFYRDLFRDSGAIDSENRVEFARLIAPDLLVIHGRFRPNAGQSEIPFVQMRLKQGPEWLIKELWLFLSPG